MNFKENSNLGWKKKVAVEIQKSLCGGIKVENLIDFTCLNLKIVDSTYFYLKLSRVHVFCSNCSRVGMFCDDDCSKLVPESTRPGVFRVERFSIT